MKTTAAILIFLFAAGASAADTTKEDIITLSRAGVSEKVILNFIRTNGSVQRLTAADVVELKKLGVSDVVVTAALRANMRCPRSPIPTPRFLRHGLIVTTERGPRYHYYGSRRARASIRPNGYFRYAVRRIRFR